MPAAGWYQRDDPGLHTHTHTGRSEGWREQREREGERTNPSQESVVYHKIPQQGLVILQLANVNSSPLLSSLVNSLATGNNNEYAIAICSGVPARDTPLNIQEQRSLLLALQL